MALTLPASSVMAVGKKIKVIFFLYPSPLFLGGFPYLSQVWYQISEMLYCMKCTNPLGGVQFPEMETSKYTVQCAIILTGCVPTLLSVMWFLIRIILAPGSGSVSMMWIRIRVAKKTAISLKIDKFHLWKLTIMITSYKA